MNYIKFSNKIQLFTFSLFTSALVFAQEKAPDLKVDVDIDKGSGMSGNMMSNPLVWVIGALVVILLIALIVRGGGNKA